MKDSAEKKREYGRIVQHRDSRTRNEGKKEGRKE
jgi:hypothetical protein